ncbi:MAG: helix-turn-helix domain-containing protein [Lachnospiraceae bacterium]|nr:helix-turn-helix domain-containing protein [Lachnospiraceae bacterium]
MKLSASLVAEELQATHSIEAGENLSLLPELEQLHFYTEPEELRERTIYIVTESTIPTASFSVPDSSMLIFAGSYADRITVCPANTCRLLDPAASPALLMNTLTDIFSKYTMWKENLVNLRLNDSSIQAMLEASYPIFGNPLMVMGMDFTIIAKYFPEAAPFQESVYGSSEGTYAYITSVKQDPLYNQVRERNGFFLYPNPGSGVTSLCVNIKKYDVTSYRLSLMDYVKPIHENLGFLLEDLAELIEHALLHNTIRKASRDTTLHSLFLHILSDRTADHVTVSQKLDSLGWYSRNEYFCIVLKTTYLDQQNLTANAICTYVQNIIKSSCALPYKDNIAIFINMSQARLQVQDVTDKLAYFIRDSYLKAGYSRVMAGHMNLRRQYIQATLALDVGERKLPFQWIYQFNEIAFDYILEQSTRRLPGYMLGHENLLKLKAMDESSNTEYLRTLRVYLDNHLNAVQSARELYIHRSTFLYRLDKIKGILNSNLDDPNEILYLMLSFRFIDMENQTGVEEDTETEREK